MCQSNQKIKHMDEVVYDTLNFDGQIGEKTFRDTLDEIVQQETHFSKAKLSGEQFNSLIVILFSYGLHYDELVEEKRRRFLDVLIEEKLPLFQVSQTFARHLLNNLDQGSEAEFQQLLLMEHNIEKILSNERLLDFVELELLDPATTFRKWEYGRFVLAYMAYYFFSDVKWDKVEKISKVGDCLERIGKNLDKKEGNLDSQEKLFLLTMAKGMLMPEKTNMAEFLLVGSYVQENMMRLSSRIKDLSKILESAVQKEISRQKGKEGPNL